MEEKFIKIIENNLESLTSNTNMEVKDYSVIRAYSFGEYVDAETDEPCGTMLEENFKNTSDAIAYIDEVLKNPPKLECSCDEFSELYEHQELYKVQLHINYADKLLNNLSLRRLLIDISIGGPDYIVANGGTLISKENLENCFNTIQSNLKSIIESGRNIGDYTVSICAGSYDLDGPIFKDFGDAINYLCDYLTHITFYSEWEDKMEMVDEIALLASIPLDDDPTDMDFEHLFCYNVYRDGKEECE